MYLRSQNQKVQNQGQSVADRVKSNPRVIAKQSTETLCTNASVEKEPVVVKQTVGRICHRYMLRSMRR